MNNPKVVVWKDGSYKFIESGVTWEYEADADFLCVIDLKNLKEVPNEKD